MSVKNTIIWVIAAIILLLHVYVVFMWSNVFSNNPLIPINPAVMERQRDAIRTYSWILLLCTLVFMVYLVYTVTSVPNGGSDKSVSSDTSTTP
jgi:uncharacterized protein YggT (Ycf19 family)